MTDISRIIVSEMLLEDFVRILIIDDDPASTDLIRILLASYPAEVYSTNLPAEGIDMARKLKPDLILLDMWMPEMDGRQVCKAIRHNSSVPILILSALDTPETIAEVLNAGADDYLVKPVSQNILHAYIRKFSRVHTNRSIDWFHTLPFRLLSLHSKIIHKRENRLCKLVPFAIHRSPDSAGICSSCKAESVASHASRPPP